jgi:hypothetical protein
MLNYRGSVPLVTAAVSLAPLLQCGTQKQILRR